MVDSFAVGCNGGFARDGEDVDHVSRGMYLLAYQPFHDQGHIQLSHKPLTFNLFVNALIIFEPPKKSQMRGYMFLRLHAQEGLNMKHMVTCKKIIQFSLIIRIEWHRLSKKRVWPT